MLSRRELILTCVPRLPAPNSQIGSPDRKLVGGNRSQQETHALTEFCRLVFIIDPLRHDKCQRSCAHGLLAQNPTPDDEVVICWAAIIVLWRVPALKQSVDARRLTTSGRNHRDQESSTVRQAVCVSLLND